MEVYIHAISGTRGAQAMHVVGYLRNLSLKVLIDSNSTHCFIYHTVTAAHHLPHQRDSDLPGHISQQKTTAMLRTLCAGLAAFGLGKILGGLLPHTTRKFRCSVGRKLAMYVGPITWYFKNMVMQFTHEGNPVTLQGLPPTEAS